MKRRGQVVKEPKMRLMSKVVIESGTGCWLWQGARNRKGGYGRITVGSRSDGTRRNVPAHAYSMLIFRGIQVSANQEWCHRCDNPPCINPDHLFAGTRKENMDDRDAKGRNFIPKGEMNGQSKLSPESVMEAKRLRAGGMFYRDIGMQLGVHHSTVMDACKGDSWIPAPPKAEGGGE